MRPADNDEEKIKELDCNKQINAKYTDDLLEENEDSQKDKADTEDNRAVNAKLAVFAVESADLVAVVNIEKVDDVADE